MKRLTILLSAAALMLSGATMTSCVKNEESQSVTDIRSAKAAQLAALAELASSQAEAALIAANADKVLKESEAAINNADAALKQAQLELDKVAIEEAKLKLEQAKATHQLEIDKLIADAETAKQTSLKALKDYMDGLAASSITNAALSKLTAAYATEYTAWNGLVADLVSAKADLSDAELGLADIKTTKANEIAKQEIIIASSNAMIEKLKTIDVSDKAKTQKDLDAAKAVEATADAKVKSVTAAQTAPTEALTTAHNAYTTVGTSYAAAVALVTAEDPAAISLKTAAGVKVYEESYTINGTVTKATQAGVNNDYAAIDAYDADKIDAVKAGGSASDELKAACDLVKANKASYEAALKAATDAELVLQKAKVATTIASAEKAEATRLVTMYSNLVSGYADVPALILAEEVKITTAKQTIADVSTISTQEQLIAFSKGEVARLNNEIAASQKQLDLFKAAIEAELKK